MEYQTEISVDGRVTVAATPDTISRLRLRWFCSHVETIHCGQGEIV